MLGIQILGKKDRISFDQSIMGVHSRHEDYGFFTGKSGDKR
jgi:hypothetical protein